MLETVFLNSGRCLPSSPRVVFKYDSSSDSESVHVVVRAGPWGPNAGIELLCFILMAKEQWSRTSLRGEMITVNTWRWLQVQSKPEVPTIDNHSVRPDIILWFSSVKAVILEELTAPWDWGRNGGSFSYLHDGSGWLLEGLISMYEQFLLRNVVWVTKPQLKETSNVLAEEAGRASLWRSLRRKDMWGELGSEL